MINETRERERERERERDTTMKIETKIVNLTPVMAKRMIAINTCNRPFCPANAKRLLRAIQAGEWEFNADAIRISETNVLLDGQHRLHAIVKSGVTCRTLIVSGLPDSVFDIIDQNQPRKLSDMLARNNVKYYVLAAAMVPLIKCYERNVIPKNTTGIVGTSKRSLVASYERRAEAIDASTKFVATNTDAVAQKILSKTWTGFAHYCFSQIDPADADIFIAAFGSGDASYGVQPAVSLRNKIIADQLNDRSIIATTQTRCAWLFIAWNKYRSGKNIRQFRWLPNVNGVLVFPRAK